MPLILTLMDVKYIWHRMYGGFLLLGPVPMSLTKISPASIEGVSKEIFPSRCRRVAKIREVPGRACLAWRKDACIWSANVHPIVSSAEYCMYERCTALTKRQPTGKKTNKKKKSSEKRNNRETTHHTQRSVKIKERKASLLTTTEIGKRWKFINTLFRTPASQCRTRRR